MKIRDIVITFCCILLILLIVYRIKQKSDMWNRISERQKYEEYIQLYSNNQKFSTATTELLVLNNEGGQNINGIGFLLEKIERNKIAFKRKKSITGMDAGYIEFKLNVNEDKVFGDIRFDKAYNLPIILHVLETYKKNQFQSGIVYTITKLH